VVIGIEMLMVQQIFIKIAYNAINKKKDQFIYQKAKILQLV
jgi:hypothetical protein